MTSPKKYGLSSIAVGKSYPKETQRDVAVDVYIEVEKIYEDTSFTTGVDNLVRNGSGTGGPEIGQIPDIPGGYSGFVQTFFMQLGASKESLIINDKVVLPGDTWMPGLLLSLLMNANDTPGIVVQNQHNSRTRHHDRTTLSNPLHVRKGFLSQIDGTMQIAPLFNPKISYASFCIQADEKSR